MQALEYKVADQQDEYEQIHALNYETFVEEIPQHTPNERRMLEDVFHEENTYVIAKEGETVVGMITVRGKRPFSLDRKLPDINAILPEGAVPCEIRLLAIKKTYRSTHVFFRMCEALLAYCLEKGFTMALISGTTRQLKLYSRIGFQPFGPLVGKEGAHYQPMYLTKENFERSSRPFSRLMERTEASLSVLPGPVRMHQDVINAWRQPPVSHRSAAFRTTVSEVKEELLRMTGARYVQLAAGSGTLANDLVGAQIACRNDHGLVLSAGEFGERLADHASRFGLSFDHVQRGWEEEISCHDLASYLEEKPAIRWVWVTHCETSTGQMIDLPAFAAVCKAYDVALYVDACSSLGTTAVDFADVEMASSVSGKGLGSYAGLAIVFHRHPVKPDPKLPRYLDLGMYSENDPPYTQGSPVVQSLRAALPHVNPVDWRSIAAPRLEALGCCVLTFAHASPSVMTIVLPHEHTVRRFGDRLKRNGLHAYYESAYLQERNWLQLSFMGNHTVETVEKTLSIVESCWQKHFS